MCVCNVCERLAAEEKAQRCSDPSHTLTVCRLLHLQTICFLPMKCLLLFQPSHCNIYFLNIYIYIFFSSKKNMLHQKALRNADFKSHICAFVTNIHFFFVDPNDFCFVLFFL